MAGTGGTGCDRSGSIRPAGFVSRRNLLFSDSANMVKNPSPRDDRPTRGRKAEKSNAGRNGQAPRRVTSGDIAPSLEVASIERFEVGQAVAAAQDSKVEAVQDI